MRNRGKVFVRCNCLLEDGFFDEERISNWFRSHIHDITVGDRGFDAPIIPSQREALERHVDADSCCLCQWLLAHAPDPLHVPLPSLIAISGLRIPRETLKMHVRAVFFQSVLRRRRQVNHDEYMWDP